MSSDDNYLSAGGGVSRALFRVAADESVRAEMYQQVWGGAPNSRERSLLGAGDAVVTSAGQLHAKYLIHAISLDFDRNQLATREIVQRATTRCLEIATELKLESVSFPAIGSGAGTLSLAEAASGMCDSIGGFLSRNESSLRKVLLVAFNDDARVVLQTALTEAINRVELDSTNARALLTKVTDEYPLPIAWYASYLDLARPERNSWLLMELLSETLRYVTAASLASATYAGLDIGEARKFEKQLSHPTLGAYLETLRQVSSGISTERAFVPELRSIVFCFCRPVPNSKAKLLDQLSELVALRNRFFHHGAPASVAGDEVWRGIAEVLARFDFLRNYPLLVKLPAGAPHKLMGADSLSQLPSVNDSAEQELLPGRRGDERTVSLSRWLGKLWRDPKGQLRAEGPPTRSVASRQPEQVSSDQKSSRVGSGQIGQPGEEPLLRSKSSKAGSEPTALFARAGIAESKGGAQRASAWRRAGG